ncbi:MAG: Membrane protein insertase YidC, partial [Verrucomicrobiales bacterium]|nr:Membrane protein insertase YidC [Verrucomicrobiales bacterium]
MDRTARIVLVLSFAFLISWYYLVNRIYPAKKLPPQATNVVLNVTNRTGVADVTQPGSNTAANLAGSVRPGRTAAATPAGAEETVLFENEDARYTFTSLGGGIKAVELKGYMQFVGRKDETNVNNSLATLNRHAPLPVLALVGGEDIEGDGN